MSGVRWLAGLGLVVALSGCGPAADPEVGAPPEPPTQAASSESPSSATSSPPSSTTSAEPESAPTTAVASTVEPAITEEAEPDVAADPTARASGLRAQFRAAHPDLTTNLPDGASCDDTVEDLGGVVVAGCTTSTVGAVWFMVPKDSVTVDEAWQIASSELMMNTCIGADHVIGSFTIDGANLVAETFPDCTYP